MSSAHKISFRVNGGPCGLSPRKNWMSERHRKEVAFEMKLLPVKVYDRSLYFHWSVHAFLGNSDSESNKVALNYDVLKSSWFKGLGAKPLLSCSVQRTCETCKKITSSWNLPWCTASKIQHGRSTNFFRVRTVERVLLDFSQFIRHHVCHYAFQSCSLTQ